MGLLSLGRDNTNYPYAVARIQAKRSKLIPPDQMDKILRMDVPEITRFIADSAYKAEVDELASRFSGLDLLEAALTVNEERTYHSVRQIVSGQGGDLVSLFLARHFVQDIKDVLRGKVAGASRDELLKELLVEDLDTYNVLLPLLGDDVKTIDDVIAGMERQGGTGRDWARVLAKVPVGSPLAVYEDALDKAAYDRLLATLKTADQKGAHLFLDFVRREVDSINLLNAVRWVAAGQQADFSPYVIPGGRAFTVAQIMQVSRSSMAQIADFLREQNYPDHVRAAFDNARTTGRLAIFQAALTRHHLEDLDRLAHGNPLSILPILVFLIRKHREVRVLRAVARGKAAGLTEERLKELIL